ncbi:TATA box-binding protein-like 1 [Rhopalosiphum padi]|uniref:TATA box-binding protein-like 1 n=1 Tax=Rhopalosiphum padi TaxID=40932 RepID=UPI00298E35D2|nr:TATA box-binding protein-like 1 [Rhopalosiphum padi]
MTPVIKLKNKNNLNVSPLNLNSNMIYFNNNLRGQEEKPLKSIQDCLNVDDQLLININNVSASFNVKLHLNLRHLALHGHNVEYKREKAKLIMKLRKPSTTANIWSSGKIVCIGSASEYDSKIASKRIARIIQRLGYAEAKFSGFKIVNVLGTCSFPFYIRIIQFSEKYKSNSQYEPELHPGVTYRIKEFKATLKIYSTGSITVNAPSEAIVKLAIEHIYPLVLPFGRNKILDDTCLVGVTEENKYREQNTRVLESTGHLPILYHSPVGELIKNWQLNTLVPKVDKNNDILLNYTA